MGLFKNKSNPEDAQEAEPIRLLNPLDPPLSVFRGCTRDEQVFLTFQSKIVNVKEDPYDVKDEDGNTVVKVSGSPFWVKQFKTISDPQGNVLFKMRAKLLTSSRTFICEEDGEGSTEYFRIKRKHAWKLKLEAKTTTTVGDAQVLHLEGSTGGSKAEVTDDNGEVVAIMSMAFKRSGIVIKNKQAYYCTVAPGADLAIITALCLAWDQCKEDDKRLAGSA